MAKFKLGKGSISIPLRGRSARIDYLESLLESTLSNDSNIHKQLAMECILRCKDDGDADMAYAHLLKVGLSEQEASNEIIRFAKKHRKWPMVSEMCSEIGDYKGAAKAESRCTVWAGLDWLSKFYGTTDVVLDNIAFYYRESGMFREAAVWKNRAHPDSPGAAEAFERAGESGYTRGYLKASKIWDKCGDSAEALNCMKKYHVSRGRKNGK